MIAANLPVPPRPSVPPERYCDDPFPAYRHVPGVTPHPTRDPRGHSYGHDEPGEVPFDPQDFQSCRPYLLGADLFNHRYWWEAHEAWEGPWRGAGRQTIAGLFLQGLIQVSVACLKRSQGLDRAAARLSADGLAKLALAPPRFAGLGVDGFVDDVRRHICAAGDTEPPLIRLHW